jgi:hypothetical protein
VVADRVGETPCVFLAGLHRAERNIAERLMRLANGTLPWPWIDPDKALPWVERRIEPIFITADRRGELSHAGKISYWTDWCRAVENDEKRANLIDPRREHLID